MGGCSTPTREARGSVSRAGGGGSPLGDAGHVSIGRGVSPTSRGDAHPSLRTGR